MICKSNIKYKISKKVEKNYWQVTKSMLYCIQENKNRTVHPKVKLNGSVQRSSAWCITYRRTVLTYADAAYAVVLEVRRFEFSPITNRQRHTVNALHSLRNIKQAATNSVRFRQTRKERVPWAHWISRVAAIGSAVYIFKRVRTRTNEPSDHNNYDLHKLNRLVWWKTELLKDFAQQGCHITTE